MKILLNVLLCIVICGDRPQNTSQITSEQDSVIEEVHVTRIDYVDDEFDIGDALKNILLPKEQKADSDRIRVLSNVINIAIDDADASQLAHQNTSQISDNQPTDTSPNHTNYVYNLQANLPGRLYLLSNILLNGLTFILSIISIVIVSLTYRDQRFYRVCTKDSVYYHETSFTPEHSSLTSSCEQ